jgi:hypothetical protein
MPGIASVALRSMESGAAQPEEPPQAQGRGALFNLPTPTPGISAPIFRHQLLRELMNHYGGGRLRGFEGEGPRQAGCWPSRFTMLGWTAFIQMLSYQAECAGRVLVKVDPRGTSGETCVSRRASREGPRADRWHDCPVCGLSAGRDQVSAQVIFGKAGNRPSGSQRQRMLSPAFLGEAVSL